jgi:hypothetical protein
MLRGSVSDGVAHHARCPVVIFLESTGPRSCSYPTEPLRLAGPRRGGDKFDSMLRRRRERGCYSVTTALR